MSVDPPATRTGVLDLAELLRILRRRLWVIPLVVIVITGVVYVLVHAEPKRYTTAASVLFNPNQTSEQVTGVTQDAGDPQAQQETDVDLVTLGSTASQTARALGLTEAAVKNAISAAISDESNIVTVSAKADTAAQAASIANTYTRFFVRDQIREAKASLSSAQAVVARQLAALSPAQRTSGAGIDLETRAQTLEELAQLQAGSVQIVQAAPVPGLPSSPKPLRTTVVAAVLSLGLAVLLALLLDRVDQRIRDPEELEAVYGVPLLAAVPKADTFSDRVTQTDLARASVENEVFNMLRAQLRYADVNVPTRVLLVLSAMPGDGKSTAAMHLARSSAVAGSRVLLLEADLRKPTLARKLGIPDTVGLINVLTGAATLQEATSEIPVAGSGQREGDSRKFDVVTSGQPLPLNPAQLLESDKMKALLGAARVEYDLIIVDTAPVTVVSDTIPLLSVADNSIIVARLGHNRRNAAASLRKILEGAGVQPLGVVANAAPSLRRRSGYEYAYGYTYTAAQALDDEKLSTEVHDR